MNKLKAAYLPLLAACATNPEEITDPSVCEQTVEFSDEVSYVLNERPQVLSPESHTTCVSLKLDEKGELVEDRDFIFEFQGNTEFAEAMPYSEEGKNKVLVQMCGLPTEAVLARKDLYLTAVRNNCETAVSFGDCVSEGNASFVCDAGYEEVWDKLPVHEYL